MQTRKGSKSERNGDLIRLLLAFVSAVMAEWALLISTVVFAYERGGSATAGYASLGLLLPGILAAPFAGKAADGDRPNRTFFGLFVVTTSVMGAAAIGAWADAPLAVVVGCASLGIGSIAFLRPTAAVVAPGLVRTARELTVANLRMGEAGNASALAGPLMAAGLIGLGGPALALAACASLNLLAAVATWPFRSRDVPSATAPAAHGAMRLMWTQIRGLKDRPSVPPILAVTAVQYVLLGSADLLYVVLSAKVFDLGRSGPALLASLFGVGALLNAISARFLVARGRLAPLLLGAFLVLTVGLGLLGVKPLLWVAFGVLPAVGFSRSLLDLSARMLLQRSAPPEAVASVFAIVELLAAVSTALGVLMTQVLIATVNVQAALLGIAVVFAFVFVLTVSRLRRADDGAKVPVVAIRLLRTLPVFAPMPPRALESVAGSAHEVVVVAGSEVIREGDQGECFYAVASGRLEVVMQGEHVRFVERGGSFGEVALLANVPRTATVVARTDATLLAIDRVPFLTAVTGHDSSRQAAWGVMRGMRLGFELSEDGPVVE